MCTVTFIARRGGYALGMNRDERLDRVAGLPPGQGQAGHRLFLAPSEPSGGTWVGVNDAGVTLALINWYAAPDRVSRHPASRGEVVRQGLAASTADGVDAVLADLPLPRTNPFRLIGIFPGQQGVVEWRWNLHALDRLIHPWRTATWISSGYDEPGAQQSRGRAFQEALRAADAGTAAWLHRLHRAHGPGCGPYSHCMHRADAATVSYVAIGVRHRQATLRYAAGAPCAAPLTPTLRLGLRDR